MHRLTILFACLAVFLTLGVGSVSHAMEPIVCIDANSAAEIGHTEGDGDQVPADGDKGYPHHHGSCHGHHVAAPLAEAESFGQALAGSIMRPSRAIVLATAAADPALRPPQA
ncbi:hypothetical protein GGR44_002905 [Sphingobium fontiphilum]|jgi:hypothetical protein|uniref:DUF2946 domain-containing protein n=1 Tax=Sphingobium fontiphilum TaxID=944425 RepID=A0A7W6DNN5_9SPHN|nr:hypothetical protein [Sphingobium fontiphilum]MBB3983218.1 hypothetical protein [Sphingobium fontiphilum]